MTERTPRDFETRALRERPKTWQPATVMPEPNPQEGYAHRWVRLSTMGKIDQRNLSGKLREGWEPVRIEEQPQFQLLIDPDSRFKDNIEIQGLLLCKIPVEFMEQRKAYYARKALSQMEAVDNNFMRENDARMPLFSQRRSEVSFGNGQSR
jgi:hypothetical protein